MAEPRTRTELLAELNALLRSSRARSVQGMPEITTLAGALLRVRDLLPVYRKL